MADLVADLKDLGYLHTNSTTTGSARHGVELEGGAGRGRQTRAVGRSREIVDEVVPHGKGALARRGTDGLGLYFISGNANMSGGTIEGDAYYVDVTEGYVPLYLGSATLWGNDKAFTVTFHGSNDAGQTIDFHMTGNPLSLQHVANMACS